MPELGTVKVQLDAEDLLRRLWLSIKRMNELMERPDCEFLNVAFIQAMNEIGKYGFDKYGDLPQERSEHRNPERVTSDKIAKHAKAHFAEYLLDIPHDHFKTRKHQLAAVAFNAMMEFQFAGLEDEK